MSPLSSLCRKLDPSEDVTFIKLVRNRYVPGDSMTRLGKETYPRISGELSLRVAWSGAWMAAICVPARIPVEACLTSPSAESWRRETTTKY